MGTSKIICGRQGFGTASRKMNYVGLFGLWMVLVGDTYMAHLVGDTYGSSGRKMKTSLRTVGRSARPTN